MYLNPDEISYYPFMASLKRCSGSCNALNNLSDRISVSSNLEIKKVFNTIYQINKFKSLVKHILHNLNIKKITSKTKWSKDYI